MTELEPYRRGLTLGLTIAEIFILLLFLLLLALYAFDAETKAKSKQRQKELEVVNKKLDDARATYPKEIEALKRENASLKTVLGDAQKENTRSATLIAQKEKELDSLRSALPRDVQELTREIEVLKKNLEDAQDENATKMALINEKEKERNQYREENKQLRAELYSSKGIDPPCWYKVETRQGKRHEKAYFLMDIAVHNEYLQVRSRKPPPERAIDERGQVAPTNYSEEYAKLSLTHLETTKNITLPELEKIAKPIWGMGKNEQIRNYSCVFYVKVWDFTPNEAKERWQQAEDEIKNWFYTLRIRNDPWESTNATN